MTTEVGQEVSPRPKMSPALLPGLVPKAVEERTHCGMEVLVDGVLAM